MNIRCLQETVRTLLSEMLSREVVSFLMSEGPRLPAQPWVERDLGQFEGWKDPRRFYDMAQVMVRWVGASVSCSPM